MKRLRIQILIAVIVFICGVSLVGLIYIVYCKPDVYVNPGIVTAPSPTAAPVIPKTMTPSYPPRIHHVPMHVTPSPMHTTSVHSASAAFRLHETSSARMHSAAGGGYYGGYGMTYPAQNASARGVKPSTGSVTMPMTTFVAMASTRQVAQPEASEAPQMANVSPRRAPGPPNPPDLPDEHQLVEPPVGEAWCLALMALCYALWQIVNAKKRNS